MSKEDPKQADLRRRMERRRSRTLTEFQMVSSVRCPLLASLLLKSLLAPAALTYLCCSGHFCCHRAWIVLFVVLLWHRVPTLL